MASLFNVQDLPRDRLIEFCQNLVRTRSVSEVDYEIDVAKVIAHFATENNLDFEILGLEPERPCVLVKVGPKGPAGFLLVAHMDTVDVGDEKAWTYPPFDAHIANGRLYGRGAADNKGGIAAAFGALLALKRRREELERAVHLVCVPDEESGATGQLGIKYLHRSDKLSGSGAIYTYPGLQRMKIGHRGILRLRITTHTKTFHTGSTEWQNLGKGYNALTGMSEILLELEGLNFNHKRDKGPFGRLRTVVTPAVIKGGISPGISPSFCEALVDIRLVPAYTREEIEARVSNAITNVIGRRSPLKADFTVENYIPPTIIPQDSIAVRIARESVLELIGVRPKLTVSGPANESYILNSIGIPTFCLGPNGGRVHSANEYIEIDSILDTAIIYALTAWRLCSE